MHVNDLLKTAVDHGASDLHLKAGSNPMMRVRGALAPASEDHRLEHEDVLADSAAVLPTAQPRMRMRLAMSLKAVVTQRLMPNADGSGRIPAVEVLVAGPAIRDCIVDEGRAHLLPGLMGQGAAPNGTQTFDQSIAGLHQAGLVSFEDGLRWAANAEEFKARMLGGATTDGRDQVVRTTRLGG